MVRSPETTQEGPFGLLPSRNMNIAYKETDIKITLYWRWGDKSPRDIYSGRVECQGREDVVVTWSEGGGGRHLNGVQSEVKDSTLLWSKVPCLLSHHVVLQPQRKQWHQDGSQLS